MVAWWFEKGPFSASNCIAVVPEDEYYVAEWLGKFYKVLPAGLHVVAPDLCGACLTYRAVSRRIEEMLVPVKAKTSDQTWVTISVAVQLQVIEDRVDAAVYRLDHVEAQVTSYVKDTVRTQVPKMTVDECFQSSRDVATVVQRKLEGDFNEFGFEIQTVLITEVRLSNDMASAMNENFMQRRLLDAAIHAAESEKQVHIKEAEADCQKMYLMGQGIARERTAIVEGLRDSLQGGHDAMDSQDVMELLMVFQYFETLSQCVSSTSHVVMIDDNSPSPQVARTRRERKPVASGMKRLPPPENSTMKTPAQHDMGGDDFAEGDSWYKKVMGDQDFAEGGEVVPRLPESDNGKPSRRRKSKARRSSVHKASADTTTEASADTTTEAQPVLESGAEEPQVPCSTEPLLANPDQQVMSTDASPDVEKKTVRKSRKTKRRTKKTRGLEDMSNPLLEGEHSDEEGNHLGSADEDVDDHGAQSSSAPDKAPEALWDDHGTQSSSVPDKAPEALWDDHGTQSSSVQD